MSCSLTHYLGKLRALESHLKAHIIGQTEVLPAIAEALHAGELGLSDAKRPRASFLFLGPTGVGKTEVVLCFTRYLFGEKYLIRLDMSEYKTPESLGVLLRLLGQQWEATNGRGTLLFDEIEKAHREVIDLLLQILDAARVTLPCGKTLDLSRYYVVLTSNIASRAMMEAKWSNRATRVRVIEQQAQGQLRPETFARLDRVLVFDPLAYDEQAAIARLLLDHELANQSARGYAMSADVKALAFLTSEGFHPRLGARPMRNAVEQHVRRALSRHLLAGGNGCGELTVENRELVLR